SDSSNSRRTLDHAIHVSDLAIPADATLLTDPGEVVAKVLPPRVEEEPVVAEAAEGEEGAEGEAGARRGTARCQGAGGRGGGHARGRAVGRRGGRRPAAPLSRLSRAPDPRHRAPAVVASARPA